MCAAALSCWRATAECLRAYIDVCNDASFVATHVEWALGVLHESGPHVSAMTEVREILYAALLRVARLALQRESPRAGVDSAALRCNARWLRCRCMRAVVSQQKQQAEAAKLRLQLLRIQEKSLAVASAPAPEAGSMTEP